MPLDEDSHASPSVPSISSVVLFSDNLSLSLAQHLAPQGTHIDLIFTIQNNEPISYPNETNNCSISNLFHLMTYKSKQAEENDNTKQGCQKPSTHEKHQINQARNPKDTQNRFDSSFTYVLHWGVNYDVDMAHIIQIQKNPCQSRHQQPKDFSTTKPILLSSNQQQLDVQPCSDSMQTSPSPHQLNSLNLAALAFTSQPVTYHEPPSHWILPKDTWRRSGKSSLRSPFKASTSNPNTFSLTISVPLHQMGCGIVTDQLKDECGPSGIALVFLIFRTHSTDYRCESAQNMVWFKPAQSLMHVPHNNVHDFILPLPLLSPARSSSIAAAQSHQEPYQSALLLTALPIEVLMKIIHSLPLSALYALMQVSYSVSKAQFHLFDSHLKKTQNLHNQHRFHTYDAIRAVFRKRRDALYKFYNHGSCLTIQIHDYPEAHIHMRNLGYIPQEFEALPDEDHHSGHHDLLAHSRIGTNRRTHHPPPQFQSPLEFALVCGSLIQAEIVIDGIDSIDHDHHVKFDTSTESLSDSVADQNNDHDHEMNLSIDTNTKSTPHIAESLLKLHLSQLLAVEALLLELTACKTLAINTQALLKLYLILRASILHYSPSEVLGLIRQQWHPRLYPTSLFAPLGHLPNLTHFSLKNFLPVFAMNGKQQSPESTSLLKSSTVKTVIFSNCPTDSIQDLSGFTNLETVRVIPSDISPALSKVFPRGVVSNPNVVRLYLSSLDQVQHFPLLFPMSLPRLRWLKLSDMQVRSSLSTGPISVQAPIESTAHSSSSFLANESQNTSSPSLVSFSPSGTFSEDGGGRGNSPICWWAFLDSIAHHHDFRLQLVNTDIQDPDDEVFRIYANLGKAQRKRKVSIE